MGSARWAVTIEDDTGSVHTDFTDSEEPAMDETRDLPQRGGHQRPTTSLARTPTW